MMSMQSESHNPTDLGFAFIDVETTGLSLGGKDRVVEIGIVLTNSQFEVERQFETLLNPVRDVGPTSIHGISARDVISAPRFEEVQDTVLALLQNRVVVGHNIVFDINMLNSEFERAGIRVNWGNPACTLLISKSAFGGALPRNLTALSSALGIQHQNAHSALSDALACLEIAKVIEEKSPNRYWRFDYGDVFESPEFEVRSNCPVLPRSISQSRAEMTYVQEIVSKLPAGHSGGKGVEYMEILDRALADLTLDHLERKSLLDTALAMNLQVSDLDVIHKRYVEEMSLQAKSDGLVTDLERQQIYKVAEQLGVSTLFCEQKLQFSEEEAKSEIKHRKFGIALEPGQVVLLTGDMNPNKAHFENLLRARGLVVAESMTKKVTILFAADPMSLSGKAVKARQYGIPVVSVYDWELFAPSE